jgi:TRAP-type C4-dicarboxylate transport system substrate-binding protein
LPPIAPTLTSTPASAEPISLKFAHQNPPKGRTTVKLIDAYIKQIEDVTKGKVKIVSYPAQSLLKAREVVTGIETGIADMAWAPLGYFTGRFPLTTITELPFMALSNGGKNSRILAELYESIPDFKKEYRSLKVLCLHASDAYHLVTSKKPVRNMNDLKGLKIRNMGAYPMKAANLLGLTSLFMEMPAVYEAAEKGVIDGAAVPWAATATFNLFEVFPYWTEVELWGAAFMIFMNKEKWESLPKDVQEAINTVTGVKAAEWAGNEGWGPDVMNETIAKAQKAGKRVEKVSLDPGEMEKWEKIAGEPVWDEWVEEMNKKGLPGKKVLDEARRLVKKYRQ